MGRNHYSEETKAQVMAALLAGQSVSQAAETYKVPRGTVAAWSAEMNREQTDPNTKKERIGILLIEYLEANLETLKAQQQVFRDPTWLKQQSASEAAVLHGVLTDKAVRLLEALADTPDEG